MKTAIARVTRSKLRVLGFLLFAVSFTFAQKENSPGQKRHNSVYAELMKVPDKARGKPNPFESNPDAITAGRKLFEEHCAECHGDSAEGARKGPSLRANQVQQATPGSLFWVLTNGVVRRGMPDWSKLPELQRWQIITYLKSLQKERR